MSTEQKLDVLAELQIDIDKLEQRVLNGQLPLSSGYDQVNRLRAIRAAVAEVQTELAALKAAKSWRPGATAPKDGTTVRLLWRNGEVDVGEWYDWKDPERIWANHPNLQGLLGEWSTSGGTADSDEFEPVGWLPLEDKP